MLACLKNNWGAREFACLLIFTFANSYLRFMVSTPKETLKGLRILFLSLCAGAGILLLLSLFIHQSNTSVIENWAEYRTMGLVIALVLSFILLAIARKIFNKRVSLIKDSLLPLPDKLTQYTSALIIYAALSESAILFNIIVFIITGDFAFLAYAAVFLGFLLANTPTKKRVVETLGLNAQEQRELE